MKKFIFILACAFSASAASATILYYSKICPDKATYTVDKTYFESEKEAEEYYADLDVLLCEQE